MVPFSLWTKVNGLAQPDQRAGLGVSTFCRTEKERESNFWAAQIGFWERAKVCRRAASTRLVLRFKASRFTAGLPMGAVGFKPVSNGLFFSLSVEGK